LEKVKQSGEPIQAGQFVHAQANNQSIDYDAIPDELTIDSISNQYKGAIFPHRTIVQSMMNNIKDSELAKVFHQGPEAMCTNCHHNSQNFVSPPPKCVSCHSSVEGVKTDSAPVAKEAYHRQCFECHEVLELKSPVSTDCQACHEAK